MLKFLSTASIFLFFAAGWVLTGRTASELAAQETLLLPEAQGYAEGTAPVTDIALDANTAAGTTSDASAAGTPADLADEEIPANTLIVNFYCYDENHLDFDAVVEDNQLAGDYDHDFYQEHFDEANHVKGVLLHNGETLYTFNTEESHSVQFDNVSEMDVEILAENDQNYFVSKRFEIQFDEDCNCVMVVDLLLFRHTVVVPPPTYVTTASSGGGGWWGLAGLAGLAGLIKCSPNSPK